MTIRVSANSGMTVERFHHGSLDLTSGWTEADPNDPKIRETLMQYVPSHIRIHPEDVSKLGTYGLKMEGAKLSSTNPQNADDYMRQPKEGEPARTKEPTGTPPAPTTTTPLGEPTSTQEPSNNDSAKRRGR